MNSSITFHSAKLFGAAVDVLALEASPSYSVSFETLTIDSEDVFAVEKLLNSNGIFDFELAEDALREHSDEGDQFRHDGEADGDALESAGYGEGERDFDERF